MEVYNRKLLFTSCLVLSSHFLFAQQPDYLLKENSVWTFGHGVINAPNGTGLNFNGSSPVAIASSAEGWGEAQVSVCDTNGNLLFYTEGTFAWDANGNLMPHGDSLVADTALYIWENPNGGYLQDSFKIDPTSSSTQGALIVPVVNDSNRYYIFSLTSQEFYFASAFTSASKGNGGELFYSVVDMTLNNGLGDVISTQRGIFLDSNFDESMVAVAGTHCDIWILAHGVDTPLIYAFNVNVHGVNPIPVVSNCGQFGNYYWGEGGMKVSPNRRKLAVCSNPGGIELCDFNPATGIASNSKIVNTYGAYHVYQSCFSPDNSKLYISAYGLYECDLTDSLLNSQLITFDNNTTDIQLGTDGKLYFMNDSFGVNIFDSIGCIAAPNLMFPMCNYMPNVIGIYPGTTAWIGLHNMYVKPLSRIIPFSLGPDTAYCSFNSVMLNVPIPNASYLWQDGSTDSTYKVNAPGTYSVQIDEAGCIYADTINIGLINVHQQLGDDTIICDGQQITLSANVPHDASAIWSTSSTASTIIVDTGTYWVNVTDEGCQGSDTITIHTQMCNCIPFIPTAFTPNKDGKDDVFHVLFQSGCSVSYYSLFVYNRWGQEVYNTSDPSQGWDGTFHGVPVDIGVYMYTMQYSAGTNGQIQHLKGDVTLVR